MQVIILEQEAILVFSVHTLPPQTKNIMRQKADIMEVIIHCKMNEWPTEWDVYYEKGVVVLLTIKRTNIPSLVDPGEVVGITIIYTP